MVGLKTFLFWTQLDAGMSQLDAGITRLIWSQLDATTNLGAVGRNYNFV